MAVVITPQTPLRLTMVAQTMTERREYHLGSDGLRALERFNEKDREDLTVSTWLYNTVYDPVERRDVLVLVYAHEDLLPRWITRHAVKDGGVTQGDMSIYNTRGRTREASQSTASNDSRPGAVQPGPAAGLPTAPDRRGRTTPP